MKRKKHNRTHDERPDARELGGESEESLRRAGMSPDAREHAADHEREHEAGLERGPEDREDLAADADDLGRRFLEDATQQPQRERTRSDVEHEGSGDELLTTMGEQYIRDLEPGASDDNDPLTTRAPDRTDHEERVSEKTREMQREKRRSTRRDSRV